MLTGRLQGQGTNIMDPVGIIGKSPLDCKGIQPVHPKGDQSWVFTERTHAKAETPILWPPHAKSWLIGKDSDQSSSEKPCENEGWDTKLHKLLEQIWASLPGPEFILQYMVSCLATEDRGSWYTVSKTHSMSPKAWHLPGFQFAWRHLSKDVGFSSETWKKTQQAPTSSAPGISTSYILLRSLSFVGLKPSGGFSNYKYRSALDGIHGLACDII